ncbi:hypothetical protein COCON_G00044190 [Conger conger]|uniref:LRRCT domain-containing protein n=1 Tax=Conger conger TaxID=82655 RepID=A0A9Q1DU76_CONCO|nr:hypothetical protein COCON_G00044190 [Conger conger]
MRFTFSLLIFYNLCLTLTSCCHSDMNQDHRSRVNCSGMALSDVPSAIDPATAVIVLTDNEFVSLSWTSYQRFHQLHELDLSRNKVSSLQDMPDLILPSLKVLHLTGNQLQELRASAFIAVSNVMELHLRANQIRTLNNETFKGLKMLEVLDLSQNLIQVLPLPLLKVINTKVLKNFDVEDNRLKVMPDQFFSELPDIPYVYLSKNPWVCNCKVQYLSGWLEDQGHNVYVHTGPSKVVNDPESVVCDSPRRLKLQVIMDLTEDDYCPSSPLGDIDAIETPAPTTAISTILPTIYALTMPIHTRTTTPTLSQTTTFSLLSFYNLCLTLTSCCHSDMNQDHRSRVNCSGMALSDVPSAIDPATAVIVLTDNEFVSLSWTSYQRFHQLHELDLSRNKVSSLQDMPDLILPSLKVLHLTGNQLQELRASAFIAVSKVMEIYLRANQIHTLNNETFKGLKMLEVLDLSQNLIQVLPLPLLKVINTKVLKNFDVEDNRLKVMPDQFFSELPDIPYVYLSKNPWVCNCKVQYLSGWLEDQGHNVYVHTGPSKVVNDPESVVCDSPRRLKLRVIMDLTEDDYCPSSPLGDIDAIETPAPTTAISTILPTIYALTMPTHSQTTMPTTLSQTTTPTQTHTTTTDTFSFLTFQVTTIPTPTSTSSPPSTPLSTTPTAHHPSMTDPPWTTEQSLTADYVGLESRIQERPVVFYCWWLFIGYLFLCVLLALWLCIIFLWSLRAYLRVYLPLARKNQEQRRNTLRLLGYHDRQIQDREGNVENAGWTGKVGDRAGAISLPLEGAGGVQAMFRSVLFVDRPRDRKEGQGEEECERVKSERTDGPATSQGARRAEIAGGEEREVHRKTVIKLISREEEIRGWSHVAMSEKDNPGNQNELEESVRQGWSESNRRASELKKRYSLILREERVEGEEQDSRSRESSFWNEWVVGEWMLRDRGGEGAGGDTGEEDWWSLMPLIARSTDPVSRGGDSSTATSVMTSETQL